MHLNLQRVLMAYRPLYLRGLLLDGQYRLPATGRPDDPTAPTSTIQPAHPAPVADQAARPAVHRLATDKP